MRQRSVICHTFIISSSPSSSSSASTACSVSAKMNDTSGDHSHHYYNSPNVAPSSLNASLPFSSLHSIYNRQQPVLKSLLHSTRRVTSLLLVTFLLINLSRVSDAKPYASKRLSFGESMDWSFGGWTPLSESAKADLASFPLHEARSTGDFAAALDQPLAKSPSETQVPSSSSSLPHGHQSTGESSSSSNSSLTSSTLLDSSSSSQSYRVVDFMNQPPQPYLALNSNQGEQLSQIAAGALYQLQQQQEQQQQQQQQHHQQQQSPQYFPGLPPQPYTRQADFSKVSSYQVVPQVPVPKIKVAVEPKPLREARIEAYKVIEHLEANADKVLASHKANRGEDAPMYKGQLDDNYHEARHQHQQQQQQQYELAYQQEQRGPQYEIQYEQQDQRAPQYSMKPQQYKPARQIPRYSQQQSYQRQNQYQQQQQQRQQQQYQDQQQRQQQQYQDQQQQQSPYQMQYKQAVNLYDNNQIMDSAQEYSQLNGNGKSKTIVLPVKEVGKDYVTVPVAVETDSDQVLTPEDIKEIEHAVLKAIPETIGNYADKIPDHLYETALPINEVSKGEAFKTIELPPVIIPAGEGGGHYGGGNTGNGNGWSNYMPPMTNFMPNFISAISPSKGKISDLLRPLLSLVRPIHADSPLPPASPAARVKGIADVPIIPGNAPYAGSHRPENLDVIHIIANHKSGPEPSVYHINQLAPSPSLSMTRGQGNNELNYRS